MGPSDDPFGTLNLVGGLRRSMAKAGYCDLKELQKVADGGELATRAHAPRLTPRRVLFALSCISSICRLKFILFRCKLTTTS